VKKRGRSEFKSDLRRVKQPSNILLHRWKSLPIRPHSESAILRRKVASVHQSNRCVNYVFIRAIR
jgi:hypothetical protein